MTHERGYERHGNRLQDLAVIEFRHVQLAELPEMARFWLAMFEEIRRNPQRDFRPDWRESFVRYFERRIGAGEAAYFVATDGAKLVGAAAGILSDGYPSEIHGVSHGYVLGVYVLPEYRGRGIATKLTELTIDFLRRKVTSICLHASPFGRSIYERLGFVATNEMTLDLSRAE
jgi:ribosomal protein S18 acetylase RimI-like enzyme